MKPFDFYPQTRIVFGTDRIDELGLLATELGAARVLVVSDQGIVAAGHTGRGIAALEKEGLQTSLFDGVHENPTSDDVEQGLIAAQCFDPDLIVGLGGGSSMDCAKGINFLFCCGGKMQDYWGIGKATGQLLPMIAVPTTAGTGSEAQSFALISDPQTHEKMACGDRRAAFRIAILDPQLTHTQPAQVTALTGMDAIAHALETYVTSRRNAVSLAYSREAWRLLASHFVRVLKEPSDVEGRSGMQLGACFAGIAIENSMLGAAHALANPLTSRFGIVHGQAVAVMLPHVIRYNAEAASKWYREILSLTEHLDGCPSPTAEAAGLADFVSQMISQASLKSRLGELDVDKSQLPELAQQAAQQWTGTFNPRRVNAEDLQELYRAAL
jgi:alcohol dehydrogenase